MIDPEKRGEAPEEGLVPVNGGIEKQGNPEFSGFSSLVDKLFNDFDDVVAGIDPEKLSKGELSPEEKKKIIELIKAISSTILSFKNDTDSSSLSEDEINYVADAEKRLMVITVKAFMWRITRDDLEGNSADEGEKADDEKEGLSEEERFKAWKDGFADKRNRLAENIGKYKESDDITPLKDELEALQEYVTEAMIRFDDKNFKNFQDLVQDLKERVDKISEPSQVEDWSKFNLDHPMQFVRLHDSVAAYEGLLEEEDWDPREEFPISGVHDNLITILEAQLVKAVEARVAMREELKGIAGLERDENINNIYIAPAENFLKLLKERVNKIDNEFIAEWKSELSDSPKLKQLKEGSEKDLPVKVGNDYPLGNTPEEIAEAIKTLRLEVFEEMSSVTAVTTGEVNRMQKEYFAEIDALAQAKIEKLIELSGQDKESAEMGNFESQPSIMILQEKIAFVDGIKDRHSFYATPHPDPAENRNYKRSDLKEIRKLLKKQYDEADRSSLLKSSKNPKISNIVEEIKSGYDRTVNRLEVMLRPDPEEMTVEELADEILDARMDPFLWKEWKVASGPERERDVINKFIQKGLTAIDFNKELQGLTGDERVARRAELAEQEIRRITIKVGVQLGTLDNVLQHENEKASGDRTQLFAEAHKRVITRRELLIATTENPIHGKEVKTILDRVVKTASLRKGECVVIRQDENGNDVEVSVLENDIKDERGNFTETIVYKHDPLLNFLSLQGEKGRTVLNRYIEREFPDFTSEAKNLSQRAYISFDFLTKSLTELQKRTQTRGYNGATGDKDRVMFADPIAAAVHRMFRYGANDEDWSMWILLYHEDIENSPYKYGKKEPLKDEAKQRFERMAEEFIAADEGREGLTMERDFGKIYHKMVKERAKTEDWTYPNHQHMIHLQHMMRMHEAASINEELFTKGMIDENGNPTGEGVPFAGFCESIGLSTDLIFNLQKNRRGGEKLFLFDKLASIGDDGETVYTDVAEKEDIDDDNIVADDVQDDDDFWRAFLGPDEDDDINPDDLEEFNNHHNTDDEEEQWTAVRPTAAAERRRTDRLVESAEEGDEDITGVDLYTLAEENGFAQLLELTYKDIPSNPPLSYDAIMRHSKDGGKGGYLGAWLQTAGRAKMFPGEHLEKYLVPMLTHYCLRLAQAFEYAEVDERQRLYEGMVKALRDSREGGGLSAYAPELTRVINNLSFEPIEKMVDGDVIHLTGKLGRPVKEKASRDFGPPNEIRYKERREYVNAWYWENYGERPPIHILGLSPEKWAHEKPLLGEQKERWNLYLDMINGYEPLRYPVVRSGSLVAKTDDEDGSH